jgi:pimeloyl-ACP methyl ester carboxylesterase
MESWVGMLAGDFGSWDWFARNWALFSITTTIFILILTPAFLLNKYIRLMLNMIKDTPVPLLPGVDVDSSEKIEGEPVAFRAFDGHALAGMFLEGDRQIPRKGLIVFCHEFGCDMHSCRRYVRPLLTGGYDVFAFDFRNHGNSSRDDSYESRQWPEEREILDMLGVFAYIKDYLEENEHPVEVGVLGISRGGSAALIAADQAAVVKCVVTDGAFSTDTTWEYYMKKWVHIFAKVRFVYEYHPPQFWQFVRWLLERCTKRALNSKYPSLRKAIRRSPPRPWFLIHGQRDNYVPQEQARLLYEMAPEPKYLWIAPGCRHNQSVTRYPEEYAQRTVAFFDRYLGGVLETPLSFPAVESSPRSAGGDSA